MAPSNRSAAQTIGQILLSGGIGATVACAIASNGGNEIPGLLFVAAIGFLAVGFILVIPALARIAALPYKWSNERRAANLRRDARYRQRLRCEHGHKYEDVVRHLDSRGLLPEGRTSHLCPECGTTIVPESLGVTTANRAAERAEKLGILRYAD